MKELGQTTISPLDYPEGSRVFVIINTCCYNSGCEDRDGNNVFGTLVVAVKEKDELSEWGWDERERKAIWMLPIGEKFDSYDYGSDASIIRIA